MSASFYKCRLEPALPQEEVYKAETVAPSPNTVMRFSLESKNNPKPLGILMRNTEAEVKSKPRYELKRLFIGLRKPNVKELSKKPI